MVPRDTAADWPAGDSEAARLVRTQDWSATRLGPVEGWPERLKALVGTILNVPQAMWIGWGPDLVQIYNDAYRGLLDAERHGTAFGRPAAETWADTWAVAGPMLKGILAGGPAVSRTDRREVYRHEGEIRERYFSFSFSPIPDEAAPNGVGGVLCVAVETTPAVLLRAAQERNGVLLGLADALRPIGDAAEIQVVASRLLGQRLGASRVAYAEDGGDGETVVVTHNYTDGVPGIAGRYRYADYGEDLLRELRAGRTVIRPDIANDPVLSEAEKAAHAVLQLGATLNVPLAKGGRLRAILSVHHAAAHEFTPDEVALVQEAAERTWAAVERARAEAALRESEARFRSLFESMDEGYHVAEVVFDEAGRPVDLLFVETNPAGIRMFGGDCRGRRLSEVDPGVEPDWIEAWGRVAVTGASERIERRMGPEDRWYAFHVFKPEPGNAESRRVAAVYQDVTARRRAEDALRRSEEQLQLATDAAGLGIFDVNLVTREMHWDARQRMLWGLGPDEGITDEAFIAGIHPEDRESVRAAVARALDPEGDHVYAAEYRLLDRGPGRELWVAATGRVHFDGARPARLVGTVQDVTARKTTERDLRRLNETLGERVAVALAERKLLADVFESTDAMMSVVGPDLRLLAFNRAYADEVERLGGRRPRVGDRITGIYADLPELASAAEANWSRAVAGETFSVVQDLGDPSRHRRTYERRFEPLHDPGGRPVGAYQFATDVTERLRDQRRAVEAEAARREADARYRAYFQNSGEALFVVGVRPDGGFAFEEVNPAHRAALGFDIAAEPGRRIEEVLPPEVAGAVAANYRRVLETGTALRYRESVDLDGRVIHAETVLVPVRDDAGRIVRIVGSGRDMTAQVQAEEALRQSQKMDAMGQLTGGVAHDFNNLLTPILGGLDRLQRKGVGDERDRRLIEGALQSAERARTVVQRLLAFARRQPLQPTAVDVAEVVRGMADLVASTTGPQIRVAVDVAPDLPAALADANQLEMAILNLAVNARDAMPEGGTLRISATSEAVGRDRPPVAAPPGRYLRLSVADTGIGMDEATLARAVEPFFSTKGIGRGTGLGLSMVHGLAAQLGGALAIRSTPGLGTNVELWLPVAVAEVPAEIAPARAADGDAAAPVNGTVLLVDDEELVRATAADMLADLGYAVVEAGSAEEALRHVAEGLAPDLVVTDHLMSGLTGTELARILRARRPGLPVLIVSGYADVEGIASDLPRLSKPFRRDDLAASLKGLRA